MTKNESDRFRKLVKAGKMYQAAQYACIRGISLSECVRRVGVILGWE